jgi:hypothetical protein
MVSLHPEGRQLVATVPWSVAEDVQAFLRRNGVPATVVWHTDTREARLEPWNGTDPQKMQFLLAQWQTLRKDGREVSSDPHALAG